MRQTSAHAYVYTGCSKLIQIKQIQLGGPSSITSFILTWSQWCWQPDHHSLCQVDRDRGAISTPISLENIFRVFICRQMLSAFSHRLACGWICSMWCRVIFQKIPIPPWQTAVGLHMVHGSLALVLFPHFRCKWRPCVVFTRLGRPHAARLMFWAFTCAKNFHPASDTHWLSRKRRRSHGNRAAFSDVRLDGS